MVLKLLTGGVSGDLFNAADNFGTESDSVFVEDARNYRILTYSDSDFIGTFAGAGATTIVDIFSGSGDDEIEGSSGIERVFDGSDDDIVTLEGGNDTAYVGAGNDFFDGGSGTDWLNFKYQNNNGDSVFILNAAGVSVDLAKVIAQNFGVFGEDVIENFENIHGGNGADRFYGNAGNNTLLGSGGSDLIFGRDGVDKLFGGDGVDTLQGNAGGDLIYCGDGTGGNDADQGKVQLTRVGDSGVTTATRDTVYYFKAGGGATDDRIDLSLLDGDAATPGRQGFTWLGEAGAFTTGALGQVRFQDLGDHVLVRIDTDGDFDTEMSIFLYNVSTLVRADFIL